MAVDLPKVHERALEHTRGYVEGVKADQLHDPTPDAEWDVHALLNHVVSGNFWVAPLMAGNEHFGDLDSAKGSFLAFVRFPDGAKVTRFSLFANDNAAENDHAYLVRKKITPGTHPKEAGYLTMATAATAGAQDSVIRRFNAPKITGATIDNTHFEYYAEIVLCGDVSEPFAVQMVYTT